MGKRCQVCDGPVVNGRCRYCGMPYRNDEVLYHLNENRTDHYRHATRKAREIMKKQETPLPDRKNSSGRTLSKEEIKAHQHKVRQDAVKRMTATKAHPSGSSGMAGNSRAAGSSGPSGGRRTAAGSRTSGTASHNPSAKKKSSKSAFSVLIFFIMLAVIFAPSYFSLLEEQDEVIRGGRENVFEWNEERGNTFYYLGTEYGEVTVGNDLPPGTYEASVESGSADIEIHSSSEDRGYVISDEDHSIVLVLSVGERVSVSPESPAERVVLLQLSSH